MNIMKVILMLCASFLITGTVWANTISISGSTTVLKFMHLAADSYAKTHPEVTFQLSAGGSTHGFGEVMSKRVHIGMMSRELLPEEQNILGDIRQVAIAFDAVVPVISHALFDVSAIDSITPETLKSIYLGEITSWADVGGPELPILVVDKEIHRGTRQVFANYVLGSGKAPATERAVILEDNQDVVNLVKASDQSIAYISFSYADSDVRMLSLNMSSGTTILPNRVNIRNGSYPLSRKLYLLIAGDTPYYVQAFIDFILSPEGQQLVEKAGYISIK